MDKRAFIEVAMEEIQNPPCLEPGSEGDRHRERDKEKKTTDGERERERESETARETERDKERDKERQRERERETYLTGSWRQRPLEDCWPWPPRIQGK